MHIKPIVAASGVFGCLFVLSSAIAADAPKAPDNNPVSEATAANATPLKRVQAPASAAEATTPSDSAMPPTAPRLRTGRARAGSHRDARACLEKGGNAAIIKCAEKFRYR